MISPEKQTAFDWVDRHEGWLSDSHQVIWRHAEPAWREYKSVAWYVDTLREHGFEVEAGSAGMPTAFCATYQSKAGVDGPVLGSFAEYDAVPANSQEPVAYEKPREGVHPWAAGHTDPHSALGMGTLAGILAAKEAMDLTSILSPIKASNLLLTFVFIASTKPPKVLMEKEETAREEKVKIYILEFL